MTVVFIGCCCSCCCHSVNLLLKYIPERSLFLSLTHRAGEYWCLLQTQCMRCLTVSLQCSQFMSLNQLQLTIQSTARLRCLLIVAWAGVTCTRVHECIDTRSAFHKDYEHPSLFVGRRCSRQTENTDYYNTIITLNMSQLFAFAALRCAPWF